MFVDGPRLINKKLLKSILDQIRTCEAVTLHQWNANGVIKHFAYLLPEDKRFTKTDATAVIKNTNIDTWPNPLEPWPLYQLVEDHVLIANVQRWTLGGFWIPPFRFYNQYFMPNNVRAAYAQQIHAISKDPEPERQSVSERLQGLKSKLTDPAQRMFLEETLNCLSVGANRAAIVMGWNLAYDHLAQWLFRHQLQAYNSELTQQLRDRKKGIYCDPVVDYRDLFLTTERTFLDICEKANLFEKHENHVLHEGLNKRNRYAHPSHDITATPAIAAGHIEELLLHIVLNKKFSW